MTTYAAARLSAHREVALDELPTVSLAELLDQAGLQTRIDRKYLVDAPLVPAILGRVAARARVLSIDGRNQFGYRSTYFDTPELEAFLLAGRGRRRRFKVRTRVYRDSGDTFLEVKTRGPRGTTVKDRMAYDLADAGRLAPGGLEFVAATLAGHGVEGVDVSRLAPTLHTSYDRATLLLTEHPDANRVRLENGPAEAVSRATIDTGLRWRRPGSEPSLALLSQVIIETKGGASPSPLDRALWRLGVRPSQVSKYGAGLAATTAELPELKWHRVLNRLNLA